MQGQAPASLPPSTVAAASARRYDLGREHRWVLVVAGLTLLLTAVLSVPVLPHRVAVGLSGAAWVACSATAAATCLRAGTRRRGRTWLLLGAGCAAWSAGCLVWSTSAVAAGRTPDFPSPADAAFLCFPLLAVAGLLVAAGLPTSRLSRGRMLLDGTAITTGLLVLAALGGLQRDGGRLRTAAGLAFLGLDVLAAALSLLVLDRLRRGSFTAERRGALGVGVVVLSDLLYSVLTVRGAYAPGGPLDAAWCAGFLVLASAAGVRSTAIDDPRNETRLLPVVPAAVAGAALLLSGRLATGLDPVMQTLLVLLGGVLAARQVALSGENTALHRSLERKVAERTDDLQRTVQAAHDDARRDALTGLPNRLGFSEAIAAALARTTPTSVTGVVLVDLDGFQEINDGLGHEVGDDVLRAVAARFTAALRAGQVLARLGGDEFAVLLSRLASGADAIAVAERLVARLRTPLQAGRLEVVVAASAGTAARASAAPAAERALAARDLLRDADTALHAAKNEGPAVRPFVPSMHDAVTQSLQLQVDLRSALSASELTVHYQPVVDLQGDRVVGVEALARWTHPERGPVPPPDFIAAAERSGLVVELERQVLATACAQVAAWRRTSPALTVAVNVSARHLREPDYVTTVMATLARAGLPAEALVLEVTESLLFHDDDQVRCVLEQLHGAGIGLALDDFGTGYSSLSRLVDYPFDTLKVDRAFVLAVEAPSGAAVLTATLAMARGLGLRVVAEGVETGGQLAFLTRSGCELAQGYLLSRPGPAELVGQVLGLRLLPTPRSAEHLPRL